MEFKHFIFQVWRAMGCYCRSLKVLFGSFVTADDEAREM